MAIYMGLDSSTQSLTAVVIEVDGEDRKVLDQRSIRFDEELASYGCQNGVLSHSDPLVAHSNPLMWADALDRLLAALAAEGNFPLEELTAIAGSGQQHGSVYLRAGAATSLAALDPNRELAVQLEGLLSRPTSPIWMDSSTAAECAAITASVGSDFELASLTGSKAFERFTGPQIRKFYQEDPEGYAATGRIHLVSSFMATLLAGSDAPIDPGDGAGMNLMNLKEKDWAPEALEATAPDLAEKLPPIEESWSIVGSLSNYWVERHGFSPGTRVVCWSGDNPCSLIGVGLVKSGQLAISLGTSDTLFGYLSEPRVDPAMEGHTFGAPTGDYMSLICFKNGSLAREKICNGAELDWEGFSAALRETRPGGGGAILLPWFEPEITPNVQDPGVRRYGLDPEDGPANVRAVVEAQMMTMALHSRWMGVKPESIYATGGASCNKEILHIMAQVFNAAVYQFEVGNSAALGAALRACHAADKAAGGSSSWEEVVAGFAEPVAESRISPEDELVELYDELKEVYSACEAHALTGQGDPAEKLEAFAKR
jgi:xylulokinase